MYNLRTLINSYSAILLLVLTTATFAAGNGDNGRGLYTPTDGCNLNGFMTFTQGGWGSPSNSTPGGIRDAHFSTVFPTGAVIGGNFTASFSNAAAVNAFLPQGGTAGAFTANYTNPTSTSAGVLGGQVLAMLLNVKFDSAGFLGNNPLKLGNLLILSGPFNGKTVNELVYWANVAIGGGSTPYSFADINAAATALNENFDNGTVNKGFLGCSVSSSVDVKVEKTASAANVANGGTVTYTITAKNLGPGNATNVTVSDVLPDGAAFVSSSASQGTYNTGTSLWTVGSLSSGQTATLTITVTLTSTASSSPAIDLGPAKDFNLFVLGDLNQPSADTQGKVAVGHDAYLGGYSVGDQLPPAPFGSRDVLIVGHDLMYTTGSVMGGNVVYGNVSNLPVNSVSITDGTLRKDSVIDFVAAATYLENLSSTLGSYTVNGTTTYAWGQVSMSGNSPLLNIFKVSGNKLSSANTVSIDVPSGSVVVVNVDSTNVKWSGGLTVTGTMINNVVYNFPEATTLAISGIDVRGSVLAPKADLTYPAGIVTGQMICKSMTGTGQFNYSPFMGNIPLDSVIVNTASLVDCYPADANAANNSSSASVSLYATTTTSGGVGSGWSPVGSFADGQIVLSLANDVNGNMLAGTLGGKIYRSTDNGTTWNRINNSMNVGFAWSIAVNGNIIFVGTESGLYRSPDNGATWVLSPLSGKDTRAVVFTGGEVYAGTWGSGIFKSGDNGATWAEINNGILANAIHALTVTSHGIYAGTFGNGVYVTTNGGTSWTNTNLPFNFVWSLGKTSSGTVFAGTYGDGLYRSTNNGTTWTKQTVAAPFIYSIVADAADNVYVATWAGSVFSSTDNGVTWGSLGLTGMGVNSLVVNPASASLFAGTSDGRVFRTDYSPTSVKSSKNVQPKNYNLEQNFPNPFNPSTMIRYEIPFESMVTLHVYDITGRVIATLENSVLGAGTYETSFNAMNLSSGLYLYTLKAVSTDGKQQFNSNKKMILVK